MTDPLSSGTDRQRTTEPSTLAVRIARKIFECPAGVEKDDVKRIAFKGGDWRGEERDFGGLCEESLVRVIDRALQEHGP